MNTLKQPKQYGALSLLIAAVGLTGCGSDSSPNADGLQPLVSPEQISGDAIPLPLSVQAGSRVAGLDVFTNRELGHCTLCHQVAGLDAPFQGNVGPELTGIGSRLSPGQLRLRIVDLSYLMPDTIMPSYYRVTGLNQVKDGYHGAPILSSLHVEDLVAYLSSLKEPAPNDE